ncbi:MAG: KpsF/GutQ family sugar-phosphate isomerase [Desulfovibrio sp.]|jgi:arabinose-5-phosphate isomerase|nr:KpsF/GutQ family sugar-phosphate isomerase [Desulfovibrio sp.]
MTDDWIERGKDVLDIEMEALASVRNSLGPSFVAAVHMLAACTGRVVITGIGKSGLVGRKIAATLSSTGTPAFFLHPVEGAHGDLGSIRGGDVVIAISYSGRTEELNAILPSLRSLGARVIAITSGLHSPLAALSDLLIDCTVPREACPMNLAPTSSTTVALALGDALAVCLMDIKAFTAKDFRRYHPGGSLGRHLSLSVTDLMRTEALPLTDDSVSFGEALRVLDKGGYGTVLLTDGCRRLTGILTDGDIRRVLCRGTADFDQAAARLMTRSPLYAQTAMSVAELVDMMEQKAITVLPVVNDDGTVAGIVHMHDLLGKGRIHFSGINFSESPW